MNRTLRNLWDLFVILFWITLGLATVAAALALTPLILMLAWNYVAPVLGIHEIGFCEAFGIIVVLGILGNSLGIGRRRS